MVARHPPYSRPIVIAIAGTPGTGKTTLARFLSKKLFAQVLDVNHLLVKKKLFEAYNRGLRTYEVDPATFRKCVLAEIRGFRKQFAPGVPKSFERVRLLILERILAAKEGSFTQHSLSFKDFRTNVTKQEKLLRQATRNGQGAIGAGRLPILIIDSHLSTLLPSSAVDVMFVTTSPLPRLHRRLVSRGYPSQKIKDNMEAEAFESSLCEAVAQGHCVMCLKT